MKLNIIISFSLFLLSPLCIHAQEKVVEDTIIVEGICDMCKVRIEEAAYGKGVKYATWDQVSDQLHIAYRADKTSRKEIEDRILEAGHTANGRMPSKEKYQELPDCCRYHELEDH